MQRFFLRPGAVATAVGQLAAFSGGVHLGLAPNHLRDHSVYGWMFVADGAAMLIVGGWLVLTGRVWAWRAAGTLAAATALAYLVSRTTGLPGLHYEAWDVRGIVASGVEGLVAISALAAGLAGDRAAK
ncbi:MAG: hypothetical protein ACRDKS_18505, partial [Actinomycetota bacterium]